MRLIPVLYCYSHYFNSTVMFVIRKEAKCTELVFKITGMVFIVQKVYHVHLCKNTKLSNLLIKAILTGIPNLSKVEWSVRFLSKQII